MQAHNHGFTPQQWLFCSCFLLRKLSYANSRVTVVLSGDPEDMPADLVQQVVSAVDTNVVAAEAVSCTLADDTRGEESG